MNETEQHVQVKGTEYSAVKSDLAVAVAIFLVSAFFVVVGFDLSADARTWPLIVGFSLMALSVFFGVQSMRHKKDAYSVESPRNIAITLVLAILYIVAIPVLGMMVSSGIFVFVFIMRFGNTRFWWAATIAVITSILLYVIFTMAFGLRFPTGLLI